MLVPIDDLSFIDLDAPTVSAWETIRPNVAAAYLVWCKYCDVWHEHGPSEGHRIAHCQGETPYSRNGYNLALAGEWTEAFE
jgi:hypothetical protein